VILYFLGMAVIIAADQIVKLWVLNDLSKIGSMSVIGDFLKFTYVPNKGAAFSILEGKRLLLIIVPAIFTLAFIVILALQKIDSVLGNVSLMLIAGGGIGNLIDRIRLGYVVDFIDLNKINFAIFNIADTCVTVGVILLIIFIFTHEAALGRGKSKSGIFTRRI
jgi:signal peptidase II